VSPLSVHIPSDSVASNLPKTDTKYGDELGLAAVLTLLTLWQAEKQESLLFSAIVRLKYIVKHSPSCVGGNFLLVRLLRMIGVYFLFETGFVDRL
jgi:hypothetical protein